MIVIAIMGIVIQVVFSIFFIGNKSYDMTEDKGFAQKDVRLAAGVITKELRMAKEISDIDFGSEKHYAFLLKNVDGIFYLFNESYNPDSSSKICKIESLSFSPDVSGEMLNVKIITIEKTQSFDINFDIKLENIESITIPNDIAKIYYTKYEK